MSSGCPAATGCNEQHRTEMADIVRRYGDEYVRMHPISPMQQRVLTDVVDCRTPALGGDLKGCDTCGKQVMVYNSCGNRHCPKCGAVARLRWQEARLADLLPVPYFHVVFTLPHQLNRMVRTNAVSLLNLLFTSASDTLKEFAYRRGGHLGFTAVLHTWDQKLNNHYHLHCLVPAGMLALDRTRWIPLDPRFLFPVKALAAVFSGKFRQGLWQLHKNGHLEIPAHQDYLESTQMFDEFNGQLRQLEWVVYAKPPFAGSQNVLKYLARYTHRVAISNNRIQGLSADDRVSFSYRDRKRDNTERTVILHVHDFIRRFLLHTLPQGFQRIRHYGFLSSRNKRHDLPLCRTLIDPQLTPHTSAASQSTRALMLTCTRVDIDLCPHCHKGTLRFISNLNRPSYMDRTSSPFAGNLEVYDTR